MSLWACGDYNTDVLTLLSHWNQNILEITTDYSINGNNGIKATQSGNAKFIEYYISDASDLRGKTLKFSADILSEYDSCIRIILGLSDNTLGGASTTITGGSSIHGEVTTPITDNTNTISFRIEQYNSSWIDGGIVYTDNWCLIEV